MASKALALFLAVNLVVLVGVASACSSDCPTPSTPTPTPTPAASGRCPRDALKLGVCADVLGLIKAKVGAPPALPCCSLLQGLVDLEAAACLCTAIKGNVLGINLNLPQWRSHQYGKMEREIILQTVDDNLFQVLVESEKKNESSATDLPIDLSLILNYCGKTVPTGFKC